MKKILLPLILLLLGVGGGVGAGLFLMEPEEEVLADGPCGDIDMEHADETHAAEDAVEPAPLDTLEYARMNNQFVVPIVHDEKVDSLVVLSLSIQVDTGGKEAVFAHEPRLRDAFLQVLFDHANIGGFDGVFTNTSKMRLLREALNAAAFDVMEGHISDVLIIDIVRQDVSN